MTPTYKCSFCNNTISTTDKNREYVDCTNCYARINLNYDTSLNTITFKRISYGGCLLALLLLGTIIYFAIPEAKKAAPASVKNETKNSVPKFTENTLLIRSLIVQNLGKFKQKEGKLFIIHPFWRDEDKDLNFALKKFIKDKKNKYNHNQKILVDLWIRRIRKALKHRNFKNKDILKKAVSDNFAKIYEQKKMKFYKTRQKNIADLTYFLLLNLKTNKFQKNITLKKAVLSNFELYKYLFYPNSHIWLYWDWSIGTHYGFITKQVEKIGKKEIIAWEKVGSLKQENDKYVKYHWVIFSNGSRKKIRNRELLKILNK